MEINLIVFGNLTEVIGKSQLSLSEVVDTDSLKIKLFALFPQLSALKFSIAINRNISSHNTPLKNGDTIALLPPFSGG